MHVLKAPRPLGQGVIRELGGFWGLAGTLYLVPPLAWLEDRYYSRVSGRRAWW